MLISGARRSHLAPALALCVSIALHAALIIASRSAAERSIERPPIKPIRVDLLPLPIASPVAAPPSQAQAARRLAPAAAVADRSVAPTRAPPHRLASVPAAGAKPPVATSPDERPLPLPPTPFSSTAVDGNEFADQSPAGDVSVDAAAARLRNAAEAVDEPPHSADPVADPSFSENERVAAAAPQARQAEPAPQIQPLAGRWRYQVYYGDFSENKPVATLDYVMRIDAQGYSLRTEGQAQGLLALFYRGAFRQLSEGRVGSGGFVPERYEEQRGDRPVRGAKIDQAGGQVRFDNGSTVALPAGAQDRLSIAAQLAWLAEHEPARMQAPVIELSLIGVSSLRQIRFEVTRDLVIETPQGPKHLTRLRAGEGPDGDPADSLELWLSGDRSLMPYRIRIVDARGRVLDQVLSSD